MTFVRIGLWRSGKPLQRNVLMQSIKDPLTLQALLFPLCRRLLLLRGLLRKSRTPRPPLLLPLFLQKGRLRGRVSGCTWCCFPWGFLSSVHGRAVLVAGLVARAFARLPVRCQAVESVVGGTRLDHCLPVCGRSGISRSLRTAFGPVEFAHARFLCLISLGLWISTDPVGISLGVTCRSLLTSTGLGGNVCDPLLVGEVAVTTRCHTISLVALVRSRVRSLLSSDRLRSRDRS